jgi:hypothetical protein
MLTLDNKATVESAFSPHSTITPYSFIGFFLWCLAFQMVYDDIQLKVHDPNIVSNH